MRKILTLDEAKQSFGPHAEKIVDAFQEAFDNYQQIIVSSSQTVGYIEYTRRSKATLLHDLIKNSIEKAFQDTEGVVTGTWNRIFGLKIGEDVFIRFKKFNEDYSVAGIPTKQFKKYERQLHIFGLPEEPTFLVAGYIPNRTWTQIEGIFIVCRVGGQTQWVEPLMNGKGMVQMTLFPYTEVEQEYTESRVKLKTAVETETKTGT